MVVFYEFVGVEVLSNVGVFDEEVGVLVKVDGPFFSFLVSDCDVRGSDISDVACEFTTVRDVWFWDNLDCCGFDGFLAGFLSAFDEDIVFDSYVFTLYCSASGDFLKFSVFVGSNDVVLESGGNVDLGIGYFTYLSDETYLSLVDGVESFFYFLFDGVTDVLDCFVSGFFLSIEHGWNYECCEKSGS